MIHFAQVAKNSFQFTGSALASFLDTEKGGDASLALGIEGCSGFPFFLTDSSEGTSSPSLALFSPTAVELTTVQAESSSIDFSTPMIYAVLVILAVFSSWFVFKRRTN